MKIFGVQIDFKRIPPPQASLDVLAESLIRIDALLESHSRLLEAMRKKVYRDGQKEETPEGGNHSPNVSYENFRVPRTGEPVIE